MDKKHKNIAIALLIIFITLISVVILIITTRDTSFRVIDVLPPENGVISGEMPIKITLSDDVTNFQDILTSFTIEPIAYYELSMKENSLIFVPGFLVANGSYTLTIPVIQSVDSEIRDVVLNYKVGDISEGQLNDYQTELQNSASDSEELIEGRYPFLTDITVYRDDYDIDFYEVESELVISIDLHPQEQPPYYLKEEFAETYRKARLEALEFIKSQGVDPNDLYIKYTPQFIDEEFGSSAQQEDFGDVKPLEN